MPLFKYIATGNIRAGDEEDAKEWIVELLTKDDVLYPSPVEGDVRVNVWELTPDE